MKNISKHHFILITCALFCLTKISAQTMYSCYTNNSLDYNLIYNNSGAPTNHEFNEVDVIYVSYYPANTSNTAVFTSTSNTGGSLDLSALYNINIADPTAYYSGGRMLAKVHFYKCITGSGCGDHQGSNGGWWHHTTSIWVYGNAHISFALDTICTNVVNVDPDDYVNYTPPSGIFTWSGQGVSNNLLTPPAVGGDYTLTYTYNEQAVSAGCTITKQFPYHVNEHTEVTYTSAFPSGVLDSDPPISLSSYPDQSPVSFIGTGVTGQNLDPSFISDSALISAIYTNADGCSDTAKQYFVVTHDPGIPGKPVLDTANSYYTWAANFFGTWVYNTGACDGKEYTWQINNPTVSSDYHWYVDSYDGNGPQHIGTGTSMSYTIPDNGYSDWMVLFWSEETFLNVEGQKAYMLIATYAKSPSGGFDNVECYDQSLSEDANYLTLGFTPQTNILEGTMAIGGSANALNIPYDVIDTLAPGGVLDSSRFESSRTYIIKSGTGVVLDTSRTLTHTFNGTDIVTNYIIEPLDYLPYKKSKADAIAQSDYFAFYWRCECKSPQDTIQVVQRPTASFVANGSTSLGHGDYLEFINNSIGASSYYWDFGDGGYSTQADGGHYWYDDGSFDVTLVAIDTLGCTDTITAPSYVNVASYLSTNNDDYVAEAHAYPVPLTSNLTVDVFLQQSSTVSINLLDVSGKLVYYDNIEMIKGENSFVIDDLTNLPSGAYFLKLLAEDGKQITIKLIK